MIEAYVALALLSLGYILNENKEVLTKNERKISGNEIPSQKSIHESNFSDITKKDEQKRAETYYKAAKQNIEKPHSNMSSITSRNKSEICPNKVQNNKINNTNDRIPPVISKNYRQEQSQKVKSKLADVEFNPQDFVHSNMIPMRTLRSDTHVDDPTLSKSKLETFTGISDLYKPKKETTAFFEPQKENIYGTPNKTDFLKSRIPTPSVHNNVLPFKQTKVGPGLGLGYNNKSQDPKAQHLKVEEIMKPKTTDELRTSNNPKITYEGRIIPGQKGSVPGKLGKVFKNRPDKVYNNTPDRYFRTTGAFFKPTLNPKYNAKNTNRQNTSQDYFGPGYDSSRQEIIDGLYTTENKQQLDSFNVGPASATERGKSNRNDYGKQSIQVYNNQRDTTTTKTYQGNLTSLVKAAIAPIQDTLKFTKKENFIENSRPYGQLNPQIPSKLPVKDPNDIARTTVKETTLNETPLMNLKANTRNTVYDPNNVARTTIKETTLSENQPMNFKGPTKLYVYDPNNVARTTIKETTLNETPRLNFKGPIKCYVHDPNDIAKTTIKETTLSETQAMNLKGNQKCYVYNPNDIARTTIKETTLSEAIAANVKGKLAGVLYIPDDKSRMTLRETLDSIDNTLNLSSYKKGYVHDPNDIAKTTTKETTLNGDYVGNVDGFVQNVGEFRNKDKLKDTHKQYLSDHEYTGQVALNLADGYKIAPNNLKDTVRQYNPDNDYLAPGKDQQNQTQMSYDNMYNACITDSKEVILHNREPTNEGVKIAAGKDKYGNVTHKKKEIDDQTQYHFNHKDLPKDYERINPDSLTKKPNKCEIDDDRIDLTSIEILKKNPFFKSIV